MHILRRKCRLQVKHTQFIIRKVEARTRNPICMKFQDFLYSWRNYHLQAMSKFNIIDGAYMQSMLKNICSSIHFMKSIGNYFPIYNIRKINLVNSLYFKTDVFHEHA